ncbi:F-box only protein 25-like isoform X2 [Pomacea canaliculata]|uniref:F-box only protein 25-like isoform X2 n=1 Tax=Pomacea canaliculata TaxID=400727 RepID=UPI000D73DE41|nr:F-box only protein 25-like isoform X2 [Pomacea canaliculata]XP_025108956.1 F-box only protein 25-like isoform X2 [Pomacea canaliculata]
MIATDWRSPGDQWVRTSEGWERLRLWRIKVFENLNENVVARLIRMALADSGPHRQTMERRQPHIFYNKGTTKERKELVSLSEALLRLDMAGAVKDIRRANFVCKLLQLIFEGKLANLSGTAQKHVFHILEATVNEAVRTEMNFGPVKKLIIQAEQALENGKDSHIGSNCLWNQHIQMLIKLSNKLADYQLKEREKDSRILLSDLPQDCLRQILFQIADHRDVIHTGQTAQTLHIVSQESSLWRNLCLFHFSGRQLLTFLPKHVDSAETLDNVDWKYIYKRCYKRFGRKETYADLLAMCSHCCSIYWQSLGHPCVGESNKSEKVLTPEDFIRLFPL